MAGINIEADENGNTCSCVMRVLNGSSETEGGLNEDENRRDGRKSMEDLGRKRRGCRSKATANSEREGGNRLSSFRVVGQRRQDRFPEKGGEDLRIAKSRGI